MIDADIPCPDCKQWRVQKQLCIGSGSNEWRFTCVNCCAVWYEDFKEAK